MEIDTIQYKIKTATEEEIFLCLSACNRTFIIPLEERVNIPIYAKKLFEKSVTFEAWMDHHLLGFVAGYFNQNGHGSAFITNVSVIKKYQGLGIASKLLSMCIEYAKKHHMEDITLEVIKRDKVAVTLYNKFNFKNYEINKDILLMKKKIV